MVFELITVMTGETNASGFKVGSDEYSKPGFSILTSSTLFIVVNPTTNKVSFTFSLLLLSSVR